ncbi:MAG TPA: hypothetical protein VGJ59_15480 [Jatrophihabitantaceae bacterium]
MRNGDERDEPQWWDQPLVRKGADGPMLRLVEVNGPARSAK